MQVMYKFVQVFDLPVIYRWIESIYRARLPGKTGGGGEVSPCARTLILSDAHGMQYIGVQEAP
jgi:hypothetical protein